MRLMTNDVLIDTYLRAVDLDLEADFLRLLMEEIRRRKLNFDYHLIDGAQVS